MPRQCRLQAAGVTAHVIQRGNNRQVCFFTDDDCQFFLGCLDKAAKRYRCSIHAYVLMTNHFHLLLTADLETGLSLFMKLLEQRYVQYVNRCYHRSGSLWDGRFRSSLVQSERYILACYRYIELNPVRAGMVKHPSEHRWSSYSANAQGARAARLTPHGEYLALGHDGAARQNAYGNLFVDELDRPLLKRIRECAHGGYALGNDRFLGDVEHVLMRPAAPRRPGRPPLNRTSVPALS